MTPTNFESTLTKTANDAVTAAQDVTSQVAEYVRDLDLRRMMSDVQSWAKENPGAALAGAAAVGFIAGRLLRR